MELECTFYWNAKQNRTELDNYSLCYGVWCKINTSIFLKYFYYMYISSISTLHPEKLASKKLGYLACDT